VVVCANDRRYVRPTTVVISGTGRLQTVEKDDSDVQMCNQRTPGYSEKGH
jgi:hypothetical protein